MKNETYYKPSQTYSLLKELIEANDIIIAQGVNPVSVSVVGVHGIGKTSVVRELATDMGRDFFKLNLSQITEPAELVGFYSKQYEIVNATTEETLWVTEGMLPEYHKTGFSATGLTKTVPCPPDWVMNLKENGILFIDDFSRG